MTQDNKYGSHRVGHHMRPFDVMIVYHGDVVQLT